MLEEQEHPLAWLSRKIHKTCFRSRENRSSYSPLNNTARIGEYEGGLGEALVILGSTQPEETSAQMVLNRAIKYLKGRDVPNMGMFTKDLIDWEDNELTSTD